MMAMFGFVFVNGRSFMQRTWLDLELEERRETVSLLLREYESSDADWLWRTNGGFAVRKCLGALRPRLGRRPEGMARASLKDLLSRAPRNDQPGTPRHRRRSGGDRAARGFLRIAAAGPGRQRDPHHRAVGPATPQPARPLRRL
jgi:hypothetical protein